MNTLSIICIISAALIGGLVSFFIFRKKRCEQPAKVDGDTLNEKYNKLLSEANEQIHQLDEQLKQALSGNIDDSVKSKLEEVDKLQKRIKSLEDEIDDYEDSIDDTKKTLKRKESELSDVQIKYETEQKSSKKLFSDLENVKHQLEEKTVKLNTIAQSLDFVQEILEAKDSKTQDIKTLEENIASMKAFAVGQLMDCYATLKDRFITFGENGNYDGFKNFWSTRFYEWESVTKKNWINGKTTIAFVGEFSAGKTSIVNRILSQDNPSAPQLPVSAKATTAIPTYIAGGSEISYQFVTPDNKLKSMAESTFKKVSKEMLENIKGVSSLIKYFVMTYKNPNLNGMSILDTPGFNSNDSEDKMRTLEVINECDALFWVVDVNTGTVNRSSINLIKNNLKKPLYVVINQIDTKAESEVKKVENQIRSTFASEGLDVKQYIWFSRKSPIENIMNPIKSIKHTGERENYIFDLKDCILTTLNLLNEQVIERNNEYHQTENKREAITARFNNNMRRLQENCETARRIPEHNTHIVCKFLDKYEISESNYSRFCNVLDDCCVKARNMSNVYNEMKDASEESQQAYNNYLETKEAWQRTNNCKEQFEKLAKRFN